MSELRFGDPDGYGSARSEGQGSLALRAELRPRRFGSRGASQQVCPQVPLGHGASRSVHRTSAGLCHAGVRGRAAPSSSRRPLRSGGVGHQDGGPLGRAVRPQCGAVRRAALRGTLPPGDRQPVGWRHARSGWRWPGGWPGGWPAAGAGTSQHGPARRGGTGGGLLRPDLGSQPGSATSAGRASVSPTGKAWSVDRPLPRGVWGTRAWSVTTASAGQHNAQQRTWLSLPSSRVGGRKGHALDPHDLVPVAADTAQRLETWEGVPPRGASPGGPSDTVTSSWTPESGKVDVVSQALVPRRC